MFQFSSHKCKSLFLQSCPKKFIRLLCECIIYLPKGNLQSIKRHHVTKFQSEVRLLSLKRTNWKQRRDILAFEKSLQLLKVITPPILNTLSSYGAVCPCSFICVQQKNISQPVTKQELPKYQPSLNPTYQIDSPKKGINKKLFSKADSSVGKILSCPRIKLSNSQTLFLDGVETGIFLLDFARQLRRKKADVADIYPHFTRRRWYISDSDSESESQS